MAGQPEYSLVSSLMRIGSTIASSTIRSSFVAYRKRGQRFGKDAACGLKISRSDSLGQTRGCGVARIRIRCPRNLNPSGLDRPNSGTQELQVLSRSLDKAQI